MQESNHKPKYFHSSNRVYPDRVKSLLSTECWPFPLRLDPAKPGDAFLIMIDTFDRTPITHTNGLSLKNFLANKCMLAKRETLDMASPGQRSWLIGALAA